MTSLEEISQDKKMVEFHPTVISLKETIAQLRLKLWIFRKEEEEKIEDESPTLS